jgi:hypothetical protein
MTREEFKAMVRDTERSVYGDNAPAERPIGCSVNGMSEDAKSYLLSLSDDIVMKREVDESVSNLNTAIAGLSL